MTPGKHTSRYGLVLRYHAYVILITGTCLFSNNNPYIGILIVVLHLADRIRGFSSRVDVDRFFGSRFNCFDHTVSIRCFKRPRLDSHHRCASPRDFHVDTHFFNWSTTKFRNNSRHPYRVLKYTYRYRPPVSSEDT